MAMPATRIYRLIPVARPYDTNWGRAACHGTVHVRARSSGEARAVAALAEMAAADLPELSTTQVVASAFRDPRLYGVQLDGSGQFPQAGPVEVVQGAFAFPPGYVVMHDD